MLTTNERMIRGYAILAKGDDPIKIGENEYKIPSQSHDEHYIVTKGYKVWNCTCPDHQYRNVECKHINAVKFWLKLKDKLKEETTERIVFKAQERGVITCPYCFSTDLIKKGFRKNKAGKKRLHIQSVYKGAGDVQ